MKILPTDPLEARFALSTLTNEKLYRFAALLEVVALDENAAMTMQEEYPDASTDEVMEAAAQALTMVNACIELRLPSRVSQ